MRLLYFGEGDGPHDRRFLEALSRSRHEVQAMFLFRPSASDLTEPLPEAVRFVEWEGLAPGLGSTDPLTGAVPHLRGALDRVEPSVIHAGPIHSCAFLAFESGFRPYASMSWGFDLLVEAEKNSVARERARQSLANSILFFCDSTSVRRQAQLIADYPDDRIVQFPWGVDLNTFSPAPDDGTLRRVLGWENSLVLVSVRSWEPIYGIDTLLEAFLRAHDRLPRLRLLLIGRGSLAPAVDAFIHTHGLQHAIHCPGLLPERDLAAYFRTADLYVSSARVDGTSVSLLQALACGLPALVTDIPSNREWIEPGVNGWLASAGDAESFSSAIVHAASHTAAERAPMGHRNRLLAISRADWTRHSTTLLEAYDRIERSLSGTMGGSR